MRAARYWHGGKLLLTWFVVSIGLVVFRWSMGWGVYQATFEDQRVVRTGGIWSAGFASGASLLATVIVAIALIWATTEWLLGRKDRTATEIADAAAQNRVLM